LSLTGGGFLRSERCQRGEGGDAFKNIKECRRHKLVPTGKGARLGLRGRGTTSRKKKKGARSLASTERGTGQKGEPRGREGAVSAIFSGGGEKGGGGKRERSQRSSVLSMNEEELTRRREEKKNHGDHFSRKGGSTSRAPLGKKTSETLEKGKYVKGAAVRGRRHSQRSAREKKGTPTKKAQRPDVTRPKSPQQGGRQEKTSYDRGREEQYPRRRKEIVASQEQLKGNKTGKEGKNRNSNPNGRVHL